RASATHDFLAWNWCFVRRCSASRRSSRRCSRILRSTKRTMLLSTSSRPNNRNFPFTICSPSYSNRRCNDKVLIVGRLFDLRHKWIESISVFGCLQLWTSLAKKKPQGLEPCGFYACYPKLRADLV